MKAHIGVSEKPHTGWLSKLRRSNAGLPMAITAVSATVTTVVCPIVRSLLLRRGLLDKPNSRSSHSVPIPRGGGLALMAGLTVGCLLPLAVGKPLPVRSLAGIATLTAVGFADDRWGLPAGPRLVAQAGVGATAGVATGQLATGTLAIPVLVNVINFMDGINGISSLTTAVWGANAVAIGMGTGNSHLSVMGAALGGSALGYLPHNLRSDRMFLGDSGSYLIGTTIAMAVLHPSLTWRARAAVLAPLAAYFADTGLTLVHRALRGQDVRQAHREHFYQKLANEHGMGHVPVSILYATAAAVSAMLVPASGGASA